MFCFTRHGDEPFESPERQLAHWAAQHLGKTLIRLQSIADIKRQAKQDGLTELANRRTFDEQIEREIRVAQRAGVECSLLLCDLDRFKTVNDTFGHPAGDEVLRILARMLQDIARQTAAGERALTARYGGEEMAILLPGQGESAAVQVAETIRLAVAEKIIWWQQMPINVTTSIGVATFPAHGQTASRVDRQHGCGIVSGQGQRPKLRLQRRPLRTPPQPRDEIVSGRRKPPACRVPPTGGYAVPLRNRDADFSTGSYEIGACCGEAIMRLGSSAGGCSESSAGGASWST